jgi:hypothetical protein
VPLNSADIFEKARQITGNKESRIAGEIFAPNEAIELAIRPVVRELNKSYGSNAAAKEVSFSTVSGQQDYCIESSVGADVFRIDQVIRSRAYIPDTLLVDGEIDPASGLATSRHSTIHPGLQGSTFQSIIATMRTRRELDHTWKVVRKADGDYLRLMPPPDSVEVVVVSFTTTAFDIETLPEEAEVALVYAAAAAILDATLNRLLSDRYQQSQKMAPTASTHGEERVRILQSQRDHYQDLRDQEILQLGAK